MYTAQKKTVENTQLLDLVAENKISNLLTGDNIPNRLEASGVFFLNGFFYVIFDNLRQIAKIKKDLDDIKDNCLISVERENFKEAFEDITYSHFQQRFYLVIEALESKKETYQAKIEEYDRNFNSLESKWVDFTFESENKGFEGLECVEKNGNEYLLAMCEGNKCKGGKKGREPGGGRIQVLQKKQKHWKKVATIKLPKSVQFEDYSAISLKNNRLAVVSQTTAKLWIGTFYDDEWNLVDDGTTYDFPTNEAGEIIYGNVEGISWLSPHQIVVVSDKYKSSKQPIRYQSKDQSIHIFNIPHNQSGGLTIAPETVKQLFSNALKNSDDEQNLLTNLGQVELTNLPNKVKQAYSFYKENVEDADWGSVKVKQVAVNLPVYAVYVTTDGDDGYLEIYTQTGEAIAYGKKYAQEIEWKDRDTLRSEAEIY